MCNVLRITATTAAIGVAALALTAPAHAGNGSTVGAGLVGFGVGAILGSALAPQTVYVAPPASLLRATTAAGLLRDGGLWTSLSVRLLQVPSSLARSAGLAAREDRSLPVRPCSN